MKKVMRSRKSFHVVLVAVILLVSVFAQAESIYVSCGGTIQKFDMSGNGSVFASGLDWAKGLAFDNSGNLYVSRFTDWDVNDGTIEKFDPSGNRSTFASIDWINSWGGEAPYGLAFQNGDLYLLISRDDPSTILKFDSSGNASFFADGLEGMGGIDLAFDGSGNLYASNIAGGIFKYDSDGNGSVFASIDFYALNGLAFDSSGNLYVAQDETNGNILKFDSNGNSEVFASGQFNPYGLAFDSNGNLYMTDIYNGTILKFDSDGNSTVFATGLNGPGFITIIPEPATLLLLGLGGLALRCKQNR